jgi:hypothetical protein
MTTAPECRRPSSTPVTTPRRRRARLGGGEGVSKAEGADILESVELKAGYGNCFDHRVRSAA